MNDDLLLKFSRDDINLRLAHDAYRGISFDPEKRAESTVQGYLSDMADIVEEFGKFATDENHGDLAADLERYRQGYLRRLTAMLAAKSRCVSAMIAGPSNFPTRQMEKRNATVDKRTQEYLAFIEKAKGGLNRRYNPRVLARLPISSDDPEAPDLLRRKITAAEQRQEMMKAANRIIKGSKPQDDKLLALLELGVDKRVAPRLFVPDFCGRIGYPDYELKNNNANIRRMKERLAGLETARAQAAAETAADVEVNGAVIHEDADLNRLQIVFNGKPSQEVRTALKSRGFRWAPSLGVWQRQLTNDARQAARHILAELY